ncbi:MAG: glycoside hydrolase family 38 C-terminal domain-containing protein [Candidatus Izemoplasmataceae bacterium]
MNKAYEDQGHTFELTSIDKYMKGLDPHEASMPVLKGELRKGKHSRVHASISGTRLDIKRENDALERLYESLLEPLNALQFIDTKNDHTDIIQKGWKYIVENHAHDSICTVCTDSVHQEMRMRYMYASQIAHTLIDEHIDHLHGLVRYDAHAGRPVLVFNGTLASGKTYQRATVYTKAESFKIRAKDGTEVPYDIEEKSTLNLKDTKVALTPLPDDYYTKTTITLPVNVEGIGYHTLYIEEGEKPESSGPSMAKKDRLENDHVLVEVNKEGLLDITDKEAGVTYHDQMEFIDGGNAGDEYDYSPPVNDTLVSSKGTLKTVEVIKDTSLQATLRLIHELEVPKTTSREERSEKTVTLKIETDVTLYEDSKYPSFSTEIHNHADNHRVSVLFPSEESTDTHIADTQLGALKRKNAFKETRKSMDEGWSERYYPTFSAHKTIGFNTKDKPFFIMKKGLPHYEIQGKTSPVIALTLLSGVGYMGNEKLPYRPGRRSGAVCATPDAQMHGTFKAEYAFLPKSAVDDKENLSTLYTNPPLIRSYAEYETGGTWADSLNLFHSDILHNSILKVSEQKDSLVLRTINPSLKTLKEVSLSFNRHLFKDVMETDLAEDPYETSGFHKGLLNTPDESNIPKLDGKLTFDQYSHNGFKTLKWVLK